MKSWREVRKIRRRIVISAMAALSPDGSNWGCLGFLVCLFCSIGQTEDTGYTGYMHEKDTVSNRHTRINR